MGRADNLQHSSLCKPSYERCRKKYPPTELEMAAIVFAFNHFEVHLLGYKITVFADHQALVTGLSVLLERSIKRTTVQVVLKSFSVFN